MKSEEKEIAHWQYGKERERWEKRERDGKKRERDGKKERETLGKRETELGTVYYCKE